MTVPETQQFPDSKSLSLTHPTEKERIATWELNSVNWSGALSLPAYLRREQFLTTVPVSRDGGLTHWILVDKNDAPDHRPIYASCESLRKRSLLAHNGAVKEVISHGIGSVHCNPKYRGRGYASKMMKELAPILQNWQVDEKVESRQSCPFSALYSDIGKTFYKGHGWQPFPSTHVAFPPAATSSREGMAKPLLDDDLPELCALDERMIRRSLEKASGSKIHVALIPDHDTMRWFHCREAFITNEVFGGKQPEIRGAIMGEPGHRMWATWTRSYYGPLEKPGSGNTLHILRLVVEDEAPPNTFSSKTGGASYDAALLDQQAEKLQAIIRLAQAEAAEWKVGHVELWNPTPLTKMLIARTKLEHSEVEREEESIASLMWYGEGNGTPDEIEWLGNEKYGWC